MTDPREVLPVLGGFATRAEFAAQCRRGERTVARWIRAGLPVIRIGRQDFIDMEKGRAWLLRGQGGSEPAA